MGMREHLKVHHSEKPNEEMKKMWHPNKINNTGVNTLSNNIPQIEPRLRGSLCLVNFPYNSFCSFSIFLE